MLQSHASLICPTTSFSSELAMDALDLASQKPGRINQTPDLTTGFAHSNLAPECSPVWSGQECPRSRNATVGSAAVRGNLTGSLAQGTQSFVPGDSRVSA